MNIVCDKTLLSAAIDGVSKAVTMRSSIPVLEGILLKAEGFQLTLTGYDLEMGIVTTIEANIKEPGEIGREFSGRDHSTIVYSLKTIERAMKNDQHLRETVSDIIKNVKA